MTPDELREKVAAIILETGHCGEAASADAVLRVVRDAWRAEMNLLQRGVHPGNSPEDDRIRNYEAGRREGIAACVRLLTP